MSCQCSYCTEPHIPCCQCCGERDPELLLMDEEPGGMIVADLCLRCAGEIYTYPVEMRLLSTYPPLICTGFHTFTLPTEPFLSFQEVVT